MLMFCCCGVVGGGDGGGGFVVAFWNSQVCVVNAVCCQNMVGLKICLAKTTVWCKRSLVKKLKCKRSLVKKLFGVKGVWCIRCFVYKVLGGKAVLTSQKKCALHQANFI